MDRIYHKKVTSSLKTLMRMYNLDVVSFSERCGIPVERIERFISGKKDLMVPDLIAIVRAFNVSSDFIIGDFPFPLPSPQTDKERELFEKISRMSQKQLEELKKRLKECRYGCM